MPFLNTLRLFHTGVDHHAGAEPRPTPIASAEPTETTIKRFLCRHILTSGRRCGSPALRGEPFCYYHHTTRRPAPRHRGVHPAHAIFELPAIDDRAGVQFALAQILARIATDQLDHKRSGRLLTACFIACSKPPAPNPLRRLPAAIAAAPPSSRDSAAPPPPITPTIQTTSSKSSSATPTSAPSRPSPSSPRPRTPQPPPKTAAAPSPACSTTSSLPTPPPSQTPPSVRVPHPRPAVPSPDRVG